jgi:hypothetical protein
MALKRGQHLIRKLFKTGGDSTYGVTLPIGTIREFGWQDGQKLQVEVDKKNKRFIIKDWEE